ncbi:MAG: hypothetical protein SOW25_06195 [Helicobacter sp.]|nr:hypothetical protein [Helicobacter sp.]
MEELKKLQDLGAKEISKNTHIALNKIEFILNKDFVSLKDSATTCGLLQILEREYHISLAAWLEEYNEFWKNYEENADDALPQVNFKVTHETPVQGDSKKGVVFGILGVILLGIGFYAYLNFMPQNTNDSKTQKQDQELKAAPQALEIPQQVESTQTQSNTEIKEENKDSNLQESTQETKEIQTQQDASASTPLNDTLENVEKVEAVAEEDKTSKVEIIPQANVWIGIIYLDTRKRMSLVTDKPLEIDLKRPQTIITGHGRIEILKNNEKEVLDGVEKKLFWVDENGNFSEISQKDYNEKTRGLRW